MPELRGVAPGLWIWRLEYPDWRPGAGWDPVVTSTCVESGGEIALLDPLAPPEDATEIWTRLDTGPPTTVAVLKPDHVRDVDVFVRRYGTRAFGPWLFWPRNVPATELEPIEAESELARRARRSPRRQGPQRDPSLATRAARARVRGRPHGAGR
ncbi:MAG TPA: hypothetical protein VG073_05790 [Gaiellaceae bacterium]|nr:hypothetical protein [Gaiellaceae bacterium]